MAWKNAHDALPAWLRSEIEKMAAAVEAAAQVNREVEYLHAHRVNTRRFMATARPTSEAPRSAVVINLDVWKSSRDARGGGRASRPISARPEGNGGC